MKTVYHHHFYYGMLQEITAIQSFLSATDHTANFVLYCGENNC